MLLFVVARLSISILRMFGVAVCRLTNSVISARRRKLLCIRQRTHVFHQTPNVIRSLHLAERWHSCESMPLLMIQNSSRSEQLCTRLLVRSAARGYIHCPDGVLARPSTPWHMVQSRPKCVPPASTMSLVSTGGEGIPWRLAKRKTECLARFAMRVSRGPGSCSAVKPKCISPIPISTAPDATIVQMIRHRIRFSSAAGH